MEVTSRELGEKRLDKVSKQSMEYGGREVNHSKAGGKSFAHDGVLGPIESNLSDIDLYIFIKIRVSTVAFQGKGFPLLRKGVSVMSFRKGLRRLFLVVVMT